VQSWKAGDRLLLLRRDAHRARRGAQADQDMLSRGEELP
jgi:hypothetical protein